MSNCPIGKRILPFFTKRILRWTVARIADKYQRARLLRAPAFAHGVNSFDRGSRFSIFENAPVDQPPGATLLNLFHHERKYFCLSPRAARKVRTVSITKLKRGQ